MSNFLIGAPSPYTVVEESTNTLSDSPADNLRDQDPFESWETSSMQAHVVLDLGAANVGITWFVLGWTLADEDTQLDLRTATTSTPLLGDANPPPGPFAREHLNLDCIPNRSDADVQAKFAPWKYRLGMIWLPGLSLAAVDERYVRIDIKGGPSTWEQGRLICSVPYQLPTNALYGAVMPHFHQEAETLLATTGRDEGVRNPMLRSTSWEHDAETDLEVLESLAVMWEARGSHGDVAFSWDPDHKHAHALTFIGRIRKPVAPRVPIFASHRTAWEIMESGEVIQ